MNNFMKMITSVFMKESRYRKINIKDKIVKNKRILLVILIVIIAISIDQVVKILVLNNIYNSKVIVLDGILNLTYVENTGGAFGIGNDSTVMFIIVNVVIIAIIVKFIMSKKDEISTYILVSLALILSGGIGNLIDRLFRGFVIDYIDINPVIKYPMFNIADICVVTGCIIIIGSLIISTLKTRRAK